MLAFGWLVGWLDSSALCSSNAESMQLDMQKILLFLLPETVQESHRQTMIFHRKPAPETKPAASVKVASLTASPAVDLSNLTPEALEALAASPLVQKACFSFKGREGQRIKKALALEKSLAA